MRSFLHISLLLGLLALPGLAQTVAPARPVPEAGGDPPVAPARVVEEPAAPTPAPAPAAAAEGEFLRPDPANDLLTFAEMLYTRGDAQAALARFEEFVRLYPRHEGTRKAYYMAAECLRKLSRNAEAENLYALVVDRFRQGEYIDAAAYRAAAMAYNRRDYRAAYPYFDIARIRTKKPKLKLDATYRAARCLQNLGETRRAIPLYREVVDSPPPNDFRESALLALGRLSLQNGAKEEALKRFSTLADTAKDPVVVGESLVRAGLLLSDSGEQGKAETYLVRVFSLQGADAWKSVAQFGLIQSRYREKNYEGVINAYNKGVYKLSNEMRAQMFLMTGNAFQRVGRFGDAVKVYGMLENFYRDKPEGREAGYRRLECLYRQESKDLPAFVDHYVKTQKEAGQDHRFLDRALLLKAEVLFAKPNAVAAAQTYSAIRIKNLPESQRAGALYKMAWAQAEAQNRPNAIESLTRFLREYPEDSRRALGLARRGELFRQVGNPVRAMEDFMTVINRHGDSSAAEFAYQQAVIIKGEQRDAPGVIKLYEELLEKFPETKAAPEARYGLGRAYYRMKDYPKALENLRLARELDAELYGRPAGSRIILACYAMKDAVSLRKELDLFLKDGKVGELPPQVPAWLGVKLYEDDDAEAAAHYLGMSVDKESPKATEPVIWKYLGKARLDAGDFKGAIEATDNYLATAEAAGARANALLDKARAQYGLGRFDAADDTAQEGQKVVRQGKTNAWLLLLRGDIAMATRAYDEAVKHYAVPSQTIIDPEITPLALWKTSQALLKSGRREESKKFRAQLRQKYPAFEPLAVEPPPKASTEDPAPRRATENVPAPEEGTPAPPTPGKTGPDARPDPAPSPLPPEAGDEDDDPVVVPEAGVPSPAETPVEP